MLRIKATIKAPSDLVERLLAQLYAEKIGQVIVERIPYSQFVRESRLNYDCVFPQMWEDKEDVSYLRFYFPDSAEGRAATFQLEYNLMQIPLNLCYEQYE